MRALKVQVYDSQTGRTRAERYQRSPVRIGRHPSNELCLSFGFVSGRHAQIDFDERGGTFTDVGSTNGSTINGQRVTANQAIPIGDGLNVTIGKLEMRFGWEQVDKPAAPRPPNLVESGVPVRTRSPRQPTQPIQAVSAEPPTLRGPVEPTDRTPMDSGPPMMGGGPPRMGAGGPPRMDAPPRLDAGGPPMMGGGPPRLDTSGPPSLQEGPPRIMDPGGSSIGPPPLGPGPGAGSGPKPMPTPDAGPPPMLGGPPMMGGAPEPAGLPDTEPPRRPGAEATGFVDLSGVHRAIRELRPEYEAMQAAKQRFEAAMEASLDKLPRTTRDTAQAFLRREFPDMPGATPFAAQAAEAASGAGGGAHSQALSNFAAMLLNDVEPPGNDDEAAAFLARMAEILQTTAQAFVEIRNVQARFGEEMGVRTIREYTPLHGAADARNVLDYLLDWRRGGPERNAQLSAVYSDFMLHQVALINGVVEGTQAMLDQFRPAEIERGVGGLNKSASAWKKYTERYAENIEERGVAALVFGPEFARAYSEVGSS